MGFCWISASPFTACRWRLLCSFVLRPLSSAQNSSWATAFELRCFWALCFPDCQEWLLKQEEILLTLVQALDTSSSVGVSAAYFRGELGRSRAVYGPPMDNVHLFLIFSPMFPLTLCPPSLDPANLILLLMTEMSRVGQSMVLFFHLLQSVSSPAPSAHRPPASLALDIGSHRGGSRTDISTGHLLST